MWVNTEDLPTSDGHPFFERLNRVLEESGFDAFVEGLCEAFYACRLGRPSLRPGRYFRLLFIGYFEGVSSERGIAWRVADSLSLRSFLDLDMTEAAPDHSTLSRTRRRIDVETHEAVFTWVLERVAEAGLVRGKTVGLDATTLEANAAMRSIERRDTGESYEAFLRRLAEASGVETPTRADLARFDRSRKNKKTSNKEWQSPQDPDAKVAKRKDGRTHLAHKAEHGVDMDTGAIVSVTVQDASEGDSATLPETLTMAAEQVELVQPDGPGVEEVVADKGYHSDKTLVALDEQRHEPPRHRAARRRPLPHVGRYRVQRARVPARRHPGGDRGQRVLVERVGGRRPLEAHQRYLAVRTPHPEPRHLDLPPAERHRTLDTPAAPRGPLDLVAPLRATQHCPVRLHHRLQDLQPRRDAQAVERFSDPVHHPEHRQRHLNRDGSRVGGLAGRLPPVMLSHGWQSPFLFASPVLSQDRGRSCHSLHISSKPTAFGTSPDSEPVPGNNSESPQTRVGRGGASSMPPQQRNSIETRAPCEWKP